MYNETTLSNQVGKQTYSERASHPPKASLA